MEAAGLTVPNLVSRVTLIVGLPPRQTLFFILNYFLSNFLKFLLKLWAVLGSGGLYWTVLGFTGMYFAVFGYSRLY